MSFSRRQQPEWQALIRAAWSAHCLAETTTVAPKFDRSWYEQELFAATGHYSSADCNSGRDYELAMAHFEVIAGNSIKWQMKAHSGDARRILHELRESVGEHEIDEDYLRGVAKRMLRLTYLPQLETLSRQQLIIILGEVKRFIRRRLQHVAPTAIETADAAADPDWTV